MKRLMIAVVASFGLIAAAAAQTATVTVQPEVRTKVKQHITTSKPKAVVAPSGFTVSAGAVLPETVEIQSFPADVGVTQYRYVVIGDRTALVEPSSRRIVEVID
ncbi:MAG: hypothetical protein K0S56_1029 [Microvirga sp.]|jgi:hypothetical protein|nr:hypothetical protein [Microvirga sp.]